MWILFQLWCSPSSIFCPLICQYASPSGYHSLWRLMLYTSHTMAEIKIVADSYPHEPEYPARLQQAAGMLSSLNN